MGSTNPLAGGLPGLLSKRVLGWEVTVEVTGGSIDNLRLAGARRAEAVPDVLGAALLAIALSSGDARRSSSDA